MNRVRIIADSTSDLIPTVREQVQVVPLTIHFGDQEFVDGITINTDEFYDKLVNGGVLPTTSQPTPAAFDALFEEAVRAGDSVVVVTIASRLSGTYQSASIAAADYPGKVFVVDSENVAIGAGILIDYALQLAEQGQTAAQIMEELNAAKKNLRLYAVLDTLDYLHKGGRISRTVAIAGGLLSLKPIITSVEGELKMVGKARGNKKANETMNQIFGIDSVDFSKPVLLGYTGQSDELLKKYIAESDPFWGGRSFPCTVVGSTVGTHAGPGAVAVAFFAK